MPPKICNNLWLHQDKMTSAKKWGCKEVSKKVVYTYVVRQINTVLTKIFDNHCDFPVHIHQILPHPSVFSLPDLLSDLFDLQCNKPPPPDIFLFPMCLLE